MTNNLKNEYKNYKICLNYKKILTSINDMQFMLKKTILILESDTNWNFINKRTELMNSCRHRNKFLLINYVSIAACFWEKSFLRVTNRIKQCWLAVSWYIANIAFGIRLFKTDSKVRLNILSATSRALTLNHLQFCYYRTVSVARHQRAAKKRGKAYFLI